jgi:hypothetical protein
MSGTDGREPEQRILLWCHRSRVYLGHAATRDALQGVNNA